VVLMMVHGATTQVMLPTRGLALTRTSATSRRCRDRGFFVDSPDARDAGHV